MTAPNKGTEGPVSVRSNLGNNAGCLVAFCGLFFIVGLLCVVFQFCVPAVQISIAKSWTPTPCVITGTQIRTNKGDHPTYSFEVAYTYSTGGQTYYGDRFCFGKNAGAYSAKSAYLGTYPVNGKSTCFVDPSNPANAVLMRDFTPEVWSGLFPLVFALAGGVGMVFARRAMNPINRPKAKWRPNSNVETSTPAVPPPTSISTPASPFDNGPFGTIDRESTRNSAPMTLATPAGGPLVLKPRSTPFGRALGTLLVAGFWNGIVSIFLWQILAEVFSGKSSFFSIIPALFLLIFLAIGIGLGIFAVGQVLALFNAKATVTVTNASPAPGQKVDLEWNFAGGLFYPRSVRVTLEGREEATYRRGTNTVTDKSTFFFETIHDSAAENMSRNQGQISLPADTMHSLDSPNNKILWVLTVNGEIKGWPDINEEYVLNVAPASRR